MSGPTELRKKQKSASAVTVGAFSSMMQRFFPDGSAQPKALAVGVSGGPDSMALCYLLSHWAEQQKNPPELYALTVDHGLRPESAQEAQKVQETVSGWAHVSHRTLVWHKEKAVASRVQEQARSARYGLMASEMKARGINDLFLAHHKDDQAETFLFRLAKGSGLDGLAGMASQKIYKTGAGDEIRFCRPFLESVSKDDLICTCVDNDIPFVDDISNKALKFARVRLRQSQEILSAEGLTPGRLSRTAGRLARARSALEEISSKAYVDATLEKNTKQIVLTSSAVFSYPEEVVLRILLLAMAELKMEAEKDRADDTYASSYGPRLERVEKLCADLLKPNPFRTRTLGRVKFERKDKRGIIVLSLEVQK